MKKILTLDEVAEILLKDIRTIRSYAEKGLLPKITIDGNKMTVQAEALAKKLGVTDFTEKFINREEAEKILDLEEGKLTRAYAVRHKIPFSELCDEESGTKGVRLLFLKSRLVAYQQNYRPYHLTENEEWLESVARNQLLYVTKMLFSNLLKMIGLYSEREQTVLSMYLDGTNLETIADRVGVTRERVRQIMEKARRRLDSRLSEFIQLGETLANNENYSGKSPVEVFDLLVAKVSILENENLELKIKKSGSGSAEDLAKEAWSKKQVILSKRIMDIDLSVRTYNCLKAAQIETIEDLSKHSIEDLLKFRNFGRKSIPEVVQIMEDNGFVCNEKRNDYGSKTTVFKYKDDHLFENIANEEPFQKQDQIDEQLLLSKIKQVIVESGFVHKSEIPEPVVPEAKEPIIEKLEVKIFGSIVPIPKEDISSVTFKKE